MTVYTGALPDKLPDTAAITAAADDITTQAEKANTLVGDAQTELSGVGSVFNTPDTATVESAMNTLVKPFTDDITTSIGPVTTGLDNFASDIENLKARYDRVREDVSEHNDWQRPPKGDPHRGTYDQQETDLAAEVQAVGQLYDEAVERCEKKIRQGTPSSVPGFPVSAGVTFGVGMGVTATETWFKSKVKFVRVRNGRINIQVSQPIPRKGHKISTKVMSKLGMPDSYVNKYANLFDPETGKRLSIADWERAVEKVDPKSALGILFARSPWLKRRFENAHVRVEPTNLPKGKVNANGSARVIAEDPKGVPPKAHGKNRNKTLKHTDAGKWGRAAKFAKVGGLGLGALGFAGSAMNGYNNSVERNPAASPGEHAKNAAIDATIETGASAVGAKVGGAIGRSAGAAIGQAIIPIPGVGAAVGAVAGGFLGNVAGGFIGGQVGKGINALRHSDGDSFGERAKDFVGGLFS